MFNFVANGKGDDFQQGLAQGSNAATNDIEKEVAQAFRDFVANVQKSFGKESVYYITTGGNLDHGGGVINVSINILNYPDGIAEEEIVDSKKTDEKGNVTVTPKPATATGEVK